MTTHASGTFGFKNWDEQPYSEPAAGTKLARASVTNVYDGFVQGEGTAQFLLAYTDPTTGIYTGLEQVVGSIDGRTGNFVLRHSGTFTGDGVSATLDVVPDSGTSELRGLRGTGQFAATHGTPQTPYTLDVQFE